MSRVTFAGVAVLLFVVGTAAAADKEVTGKLVAVDADGKKITIVENGKNAEYGLNSRGVVVTVDGKESKAGLEDKALRKGAEVTLTIPATGKLVKAIDIETRKAAAAAKPDKPDTPKPAATNDKEVKGKLVSVDADDHKITISEGGKNVEYSLNSRGLVVTVNDKESKDGLKDKALAKGTEVTLVIPARGRLVKEIVIEQKKTTSLKPKEPPDTTTKPKPKETDTTPKPKPATTDDKPGVKGTAATVVKVDLAKMILTVKVDGKTMDLTIGEDTKFIGPRGGDRGTGEKGLKDDVLAPGAEIHFVGSKNGKQIEEIHLPVRKSADK
jgi:predicted RNA-binding protein